MTADVPDVLADPVGVIVAMISGIEPSLELAVIEQAVISVAGGRAKRRKLAQALASRPAILADGRSPAPRAAGDLLVALRKAGAGTVSPPACAGCGKQLRSFQRRSEDWFCSACGPKREPCAGCGKVRAVHLRGRDGGPRCAKCPPAGDPVSIVTGIVAAIDPGLPAGTAAAAVTAAAAQAGQRHQLAWALQDRPELLTGEGAAAPVPSVLRLIDQLAQVGAKGIVRPPCPHCGRVIPLVKPRGGVRLCRNCVARSRAEPCSRCGTVREAATRDKDGRPLCPHCLVTDPANQETCTGCRRRRPVSVRTPEGPLCPSCRPWHTATSGICGREAPCVTSQATGEPWCGACKQRRARCSGCGRTGRVRGGTRAEPLCATCTRSDAGFWTRCPACGETGRIHAGRCARCATDRRLRELLGDEAGEIRPSLLALYQALAAAERPGTVAAWLDKSPAPAIVQSLDAGAGLTHAALDALPGGKPVEHLRSILVAIGTLPHRDEQMARLERWITAATAGRDDPGQQHLLHHYAIWHLLRRLRRRTAGAGTTHDQLVGVRQHVKAAIAFLDWLTARNLTLAACRQNDLDASITGGQASYRRETGHFIRWAKQQKLTSLDFPATRWGGPSRVIDAEARWEQARRLLHDASLGPEDRVAGLLVLLYAQWPSVISRLTLGHVHTDDQQVQLSLGREPVTLPEPLASLVRQLLAARRGHAAIGDDGTSAWLFPGGQPGRPISSYRLAERLRELGIHSGQARSTALFQLATDLPAAVLARLLGIHITVAVAWQRASAGDWAASPSGSNVSRLMTSTDSGDKTGGGEPLIGDGVTPGIVRIGDTVRRPVRPFTRTVHAYLAHLHQAGFTAAPVPLGIDDQGREVLSFVTGDVPREPLSAETAGDDVLVALARLIGALHAASAGWTPPPDAVWGGIPGAGAAALPPVDGEPELVSHRDYCPGNVVFRDGLPAALIDFDLAKPTTRLYDIANALWWWAPLRDPQDRAPAFTDLDIPHRAAVFADAYGMTAQQRRDLVPLMTRIAHRYHRTARAAADADPVFRRLWEQGAKDELPRAEAWLQQAGPAIVSQLTGITGHQQS